MADAVQTSPERPTSTHPLRRRGGKRNGIDSCCLFCSAQAPDPNGVRTAIRRLFRRAINNRTCRFSPKGSGHITSGQHPDTTENTWQTNELLSLSAPRHSPCTPSFPRGREPGQQAKSSPSSRRSTPGNHHAPSTATVTFYPTVPSIRARDPSPPFTPQPNGISCQKSA